MAPDRPGIIKISGVMQKNRAVYCIEDKGIGISARDQTKIFELFHRLDPKTGGGGLGLTIIQKIMERHNGEVRVESALDKRSRFYVCVGNLSLKGTPH